MITSRAQIMHARWALLVVASGCVDSAAISYQPDPSARTTVFIEEELVGAGWLPVVGFVFDHDANEWEGLPLNVARDGRLFALAYRDPIGALQLDEGTLLPDPIGARSIPTPDLGTRRLDPPLDSSSWMESEPPFFPLERYSMSDCIDDGLCVAERGDEYCTACTATVALPSIAPPTPPDVAPFPRLESCAPGFADFLGGSGCEPVGTGCPSIPGAPVVLDGSELLQAINTRTPTIALAEGLFDLPPIALLGPIAIIGCGSGSILRLGPDAFIALDSDRITLRNLRIEGGVSAILVQADVSAELDEVSIDGGGANGIVSVGDLRMHRVSIEGRTTGLLLASGSAIVDHLAIRDTMVHGVACSGSPSAPLPTARLNDLAIQGTPILAEGRTIFGSSGCTMSIERVAIERARRAAIEVTDPSTLVTRLADVTVRDLLVGAPGGFTGAISGSVRARIASIARVWIEDVFGTAMEIGNPEVVIEDVHIENVAPRNAGDRSYGLRVGVQPEDNGKTTSIARVDIRDAGAAFLMEALRYGAPPARGIVRDVRILSDPATETAFRTHAYDVDIERVRIEGGGDGMLISDGGLGTVRHVEIAGCTTRGFVVEIDDRTSVDVDGMRISGCRDGIHVYTQPVLPGVRTLDFNGRNLAAIDNSSYGIIVEGSSGSLEQIELRDNTIGLGLAAGPAFIVQNGSITGNEFGARLVPGLDPLQVLIGIRFSENGRGLETDVRVP